MLSDQTSFRLHRSITPSGVRIPSARGYWIRAAASRASHPKSQIDKNEIHDTKKLPVMNLFLE